MLDKIVKKSATKTEVVGKSNKNTKKDKKGLDKHKKVWYTKNPHCERQTGRNWGNWKKLKKFQKNAWQTQKVVVKYKSCRWAGLGRT